MGRPVGLRLVLASGGGGGDDGAGTQGAEREG